MPFLSQREKLGSATMLREALHTHTFHGIGSHYPHSRIRLRADTSG